MILTELYITVFTRHLLSPAGSSQIQNLQFRGQWYMVTQRGMKGFSPHEALQPAKGGVWSPVDKRLCVARHCEFGGS